ncbi:Rubrerythrin [Belnapia rosea]|nr:Rubrerythrin [Belnapia rosea]
MSLLRGEPPASVRSLAELFAIAMALETEAAQRYAALDEQMLAVGQQGVAEVFRHLAAEERGHADHVRDWSCSTTGAAPDPAWIRWQPPETLEEEEARGIASSSLASAYRALSMAVRNEERAFAFWSYVAAQADEPAIQHAAERMAGEELHHAALLRRERRRAFHAERHHARAAPLRPALEAVRAERALAVLLPALADGEMAASAEFRRLVGEAASMAEEATSVADEAEEIPAGEVAPAGNPPRLPEALRLAELALDAYLGAADIARDEVVMRRLQGLAERGIARVVLLRRLSGHV